MATETLEAPRTRKDSARDPALKTRPLGGRVLIRRVKPEEKVGGIILPEQARGKSQKARVLAVGPGKWNEYASARVPPQVKVGDIVLVGQWVGVDVQDSSLPRDDDVLLVPEEDILAIIEG